MSSSKKKRKINVDNCINNDIKDLTTCNNPNNSKKLKYDEKRSLKHNPTLDQMLKAINIDIFVLNSDSSERIIMQNFAKNMICHITNLCETNKNNISYKQDINTYSTGVMPKINLDAYIIRCIQYLDITPQCFIIALIYIDKLRLYHKKINISYNNIYTILIIAMLIAGKYNDDECYSNQIFATVADMKLAYFNKFEVQFIFDSYFDFTFSDEVYDKYFNKFNS
jgi:hypothetical protein